MFRVIKLGIISFIVVFIIVFLMSLLIPSHVRISRAINIEAPQGKIYPLLADTANWKKWNVMANKKLVSDISSRDSSMITTRWTFGGRSVTGAYRLERIADVTVVQWYFDFRLNWYPWEKFGSITFEKQFGPPMETSLINLKDLVDNSP
jgi:hypothetical protein